MSGASKLLLAGLAGAVVALVLAWKFFLAPESAGLPPSVGGTPADVTGTTPELAPREEVTGRIAAKEPTPEVVAPSAPKAKPPVSIRIRGCTLDIQGSPVAGVEVGVDGRRAPRARSDAFGFFDIDLDEPGGRLVAVSEDWVTVRYDAVHERNRDREHFLIVAPPISLTGHVYDVSRCSLKGATVAIDIPIAAFAGFPLALDSTGLERIATKSGADGAFELERVPSLARAQLLTSLEGFERDARPLPSRSEWGLIIELKEEGEAGTRESGTQEGVVVHEDGTPAKGARVILVDSETKTDAEGRFRLKLVSAGSGTPLVAILQGFQPAVLPDYGRLLAATRDVFISTDWHPPPVRLVLGPPPLSIAGRVLEQDDEPCPAWTVSLEGTEVSQYRIPVVTAEELTMGSAARVVTDADGAFRLGGLRSMAYRLRAWGKDGRMIHSGGIQAGTEDVVLRTEPQALVARLTGRVSAHDGTPVEGVDVRLDLVTYQTSYGFQSQSLKAATTGPDGTFELDNVPRRFTRLSVTGESILDAGRDMHGVDLDQRIEIVVFRRCRFRFEGAGGEDGSTRPTRIAVLDAEGKPLSLTTREHQRSMSGPFAELTDGASLVLSVSEAACRLVLYEGEEVLSSQPLRLTPGEITTVRPAQ